MDFLWPGLLFLLVLIPILIGVYIWALRRKRRFTVRYSSLTLVRQAIPRYSRIRRHLPFALFLLAMAGLILAMARPVAIVTVPSDQTTIILAIDVSFSMRAPDIQPTRLRAAQDAALSFVQRQAAQTRIGIVAFSGFAELIQPPTTDQDALTAAIESLTLGRRTAIGSGILKSIDAIAEVDPSVPQAVLDPSTSEPVPPVPQGAFAPDIIVLLTDGVSNAGVQPLDAAQQAADRGIRVYTIGYGTANYTFQGFGGGGGNPFGGPPQGGNDPFGGGGGGGRNFGGGGFRMGIDETTLKKIAEMTGGSYYSAQSASEIQDVFKNLPTYLIAKHETTEISFAFAGLGALLAAAAVFLALRWNPLS